MQPRIKQQQQKSVPAKRKCNNNNNEKRKIKQVDENNQHVFTNNELQFLSSKLKKR